LTAAKGNRKLPPAMPLIANLIAKLQRHPKRIVFPEGSDPRILQAARQIVTRRMGVPVLLGDRLQIKETAARLDLSTEGMRLIEPERSDDFEDFVTSLETLRRYKGLKADEARSIMRNVNYFATMMLERGQADALVGGATATASSALRPLFQIIAKQEGVQTASSMLVLDTENEKIGIEGVIFMADCGVIPEPTPEQLADIAVTTALLASHLTNQLPRVAMLSFSTKSSSSHPAVMKMRAATELAREKARKFHVAMEIDGELQVDAALDPATAKLKDVASSVAGRANVLIFPDLNSGNIASKMVQALAGANMHGQIITGLRRPAAEISRSASAHDILGAAAIVGCQAIDRRLLYGTL
jgi:phosphate acetyltransferase